MNFQKVSQNPVARRVCFGLYKNLKRGGFLGEKTRRHDGGFRRRRRDPRSSEEENGGLRSRTGLGQVPQPQKSSSRSGNQLLLSSKIRDIYLFFLSQIAYTLFCALPIDSQRSDYRFP